MNIILRKNIKLILLLLSLIMVISCSGKKENSDDKKSEKKESKIVENLSEDELQRKEGVNDNLPDIVYTYEGIVDAAPGLYQEPDLYSPDYKIKVEEWRKNIQNELKKIKPTLSENANEAEIQNLFKKYLYIAGYDYTPIETIDRFSYVIFKKDMENPFTKQKIQENMNVNIEIVLDASGSMKQKIDDKTMMEIAKESIQKVVSSIPANAKVGLRIFGHKGDNTSAKKQESCSANELVLPINKVNQESVKNVLSQVNPTGWTSIAKSIENGVNDLKGFEDKNTLNILYIVTDGIETCGGNPVEMAKKLKNENSNIVLGIIGFNVDANQDRVLKEIAKAANGHYSSANNAEKLTAELYNIHELAFSEYKWETLGDNLLNRIAGSHELTLTFNNLIDYSLSEENILNDLVFYGGTSYSEDPEFAGLYKSSGKVATRLKELIKERRNKIKSLYETEYNKIVKQSQDYLTYIRNRKGEIVAYIPTTSRKNPMSKYYSGLSNKGGTRNDAIKDNGQLREEQKNIKK